MGCVLRAFHVGPVAVLGVRGIWPRSGCLWTFSYGPLVLQAANAGDCSYPQRYFDCDCACIDQDGPDVLPSLAGSGVLQPVPAHRACDEQRQQPDKLVDQVQLLGCDRRPGPGEQRIYEEPCAEQGAEGGLGSRPLFGEVAELEELGAVLGPLVSRVEQVDHYGQRQRQDQLYCWVSWCQRQPFEALGHCLVSLHILQSSGPHFARTL